MSAVPAFLFICYLMLLSSPHGVVIHHLGRVRTHETMRHSKRNRKAFDELNCSYSVSVDRRKRAGGQSVYIHTAAAAYRRRLGKTLKLKIKRRVNLTEHFISERDYGLFIYLFIYFRLFKVSEAIYHQPSLKRIAPELSG